MADKEVIGVVVSLDGGETFRKREKAPGSNSLLLNDLAESPTPYIAHAIGPAFEGSTLAALTAPARVSDPVLSGSAVLGGTLTRQSPGVVSGNPAPEMGPPLFAMRADSNAAAQIITGASGETLTVDDAIFDIRNQIRTGTRFFNSQGEITLWSNWVEVAEVPQITAAPITLTAGQQATIQFNTAPDTVTVAQGNTTLTATRVGTTNDWTFTPATTEPVAIGATKAGWKECSATITPASAAPKLQNATENTVQIINVDETSAPFSLTIGAPSVYAGTYTITPAAMVDGPVALVAPSISGTAQAGTLWTVKPGLWATLTGVVNLAWVWPDGSTGTTYVAREADRGVARSVTVTGTDTRGDTDATSNAITVPAGALSDAMRVQTGSYTGTGARIDVPLDFEPDLVMVFAESTAQPAVWRGDTSWHGRSQRLDAGDSDYQLCRFNGQPYEKFKGNGFGALAAYSASGRTYRFIAIRYNGSPAVAHTSIIGNAVIRDLVYADWAPELTLVKRDSPQPAVITLTGRTPEQSTTTAGALPGAVEHIPGGARLSGENQVNQNTPPGLGEGIEHMAFRTSAAVTPTHYIGNGAGSRALGFGATAALIVPVTSTGPASVLVTAEGARGVSGEAVSGFVAGADLTVPAAYNDDGVEYRVLAFRDTGAAIVADTVPVPAACGIATGVEAKLSDSFALSGPCAIEWWGKPKSVYGSKFFVPMLMGGVGQQSATVNRYNCGLYGYAADPDNHGWAGAAIRWMQHPRMAPERVSPYASMNRYNLNSGIVTAINDPVHMVLVHHGQGLWRLFVNGRLAKEHRRSMTLETSITLPDGGEGVARALYLFSHLTDSGIQAVEGEIYRVQAWASALTDTQAKDLYRQAKGQTVSIPAARDTWDFRSGIPAGVTGITAGVPGQQQVTLTVTPNSITQSAAVGTVVATIASDATGFALSGTDAGKLSVSGTNIVTTVSLSGEAALDFTVTASRSGYTSRSQTLSITVTSGAGAWAFPTFLRGTELTTRGTITGPDGNGDLTIGSDNIAAPNGNTSGNPRVYFDVVPGTAYELETHIQWGNATRVIGRLSDTTGNNAGVNVTVFDITKGAETTLDRSDTFTPTTGRVAMHYVFMMNQTGTSKILSTTRVRSA